MEQSALRTWVSCSYDADMIMRSTTERINIEHHWCLPLTHWGRVTHICVGNSPIIGSDNGLSPDRRQAIIWTNAGNPVKFNQKYNVYIQENAFERVVWKTAAILSQPQCVNSSPLDKMAAIPQKIFLDAFSWMKMYEFCLRFHSSLFLRFKLTIFEHWFR